MTTHEWLRPEDLDVQIEAPGGIGRVFEQGLVDLAPWHLMGRDVAQKRLIGLRQRYTRRYVPFAWRQDNDDIACLDPEHPGQVVIVHDFANEGYEQRRRFESFWDWFRMAIEEMIAFE